VDYILGLSTNERLKRLTAPLLDDAETEWRSWHRPVRHFHEQRYRARSWKRSSRLLIKAEHNGIGRNARFVITSLDGDPQALYDEVYCARATGSHATPRWGRKYATPPPAERRVAVSI
jgi:hypothetical protein